MPEESRIEVKGSVIEALSATRFRVALANGRQVPAGLSGKMRMNMIRILPGMQVLVEFSPYDLSRGRIIGVTDQQD